MSGSKFQFGKVSDRTLIKFSDIAKQNIEFWESFFDSVNVEMEKRGSKRVK